jgi:hypothetical protein
LPTEDIGHVIHWARLWHWRRFDQAGAFTHRLRDYATERWTGHKEQRAWRVFADSTASELDRRVARIGTISSTAI